MPTTNPSPAAREAVLKSGNCNRCGVFLPQVKRGRYICLECNRLRKKEWELHRASLGLPPWVKPRDYSSPSRKAREKERIVSGKAAEYARRVLKTEEGRMKASARSKAKNAVARGRLVRQECYWCSNPNTEAHHHDYSKPLDVQWLCPACHSATHSAERFNEKAGLLEALAVMAGFWGER